MENDFFGLKLGPDLENQAARPHQELPGVPGPSSHQNRAFQTSFINRRLSNNLLLSYVIPFYEVDNLYCFNDIRTLLQINILAMNKLLSGVG